MHNLKLILLLGGLGALLASGCIFKPKPDPPEPPRNLYSESLIHPDSLITDLQVSYRRREIDPYANLLAPEFIFVFQEGDATEIPEGFWNKDEDSTGTRSLFESIQVVDVRISLNWFPGESAVTSNNEPALRIAVITNLDVDVDGGATTLRVPGDQQHFYFRQGREENGEDPTRWYISEWRDLGNAGGTGAPRGDLDPLSRDAGFENNDAGRRIEVVTMGELRRRIGLGS
jgi:hypothetical protein